MKNVLNHALFKHQESTSEGFNNLCTIIHQLRDEGTYFGEVQRTKYIVGTFTLRFDKTLTTHQVHIDAAKFDPVFNKNRSAPQAESGFEVGGEGYVLFYTSGAHTDLRIKLHRRTEKNTDEVSYDTAKLASGDMVVFRLLAPGAYRIRQGQTEHAMSVSVRSAEKDNYPGALGKFPPVNVKLTSRGFEPAKVDYWPLQALIIQLETAGPLSVESVEKGA
jgi:hypothetical protein